MDMIGQIIKKQALLLIRNPVQLLLLIGLPIILILILGNALGSMMNGDSSGLKVKLALIEHQPENEQVENFLASIDNPKGTKVEQSDVTNIAPIQTLKSILTNDELKGVIDVREVPFSEKQAVLDDNTYTAVIEIPRKFTHDFLSYTIFGEGNKPKLQLYENEQQQIGAGVIRSLLEDLQRQYTLASFLQEKEIDQQVLAVETALLNNNQQSINQKNPVTSKGYYTIGMAVMTVLYIAATIGSLAFMEKRIFVFNRIIIGNMSRWVYFTGILLSGMIFGCLHLGIIFSFAWITFGVSWPNIMALLLVTFAFSIAVGGIAVLLTAISYRLHSETVTNFFSGIVVSLMALMGGSFYPIGDNSTFIQTLGNLTPNGAGMSAYLSILRGDNISAISSNILFLCLFGMAMILIAASTFPKRGEAV